MRAQYTTIFVWQSEVAIFARKFGCMHLACTLSSFPHRNKITSPRACVLLFRRRKSFIFISCSSDWLYANEFVLGVRNCGGKNNFATRRSGESRYSKLYPAPHVAFWYCFRSRGRTRDGTRTKSSLIHASINSPPSGINIFPSRFAVREEIAEAWRHRHGVFSRSPGRTEVRTRTPPRTLCRSRNSPSNGTTLARSRPAIREKVATQN